MNNNFTTYTSSGLICDCVFQADKYDGCNTNVCLFVHCQVFFHRQQNLQMVKGGNLFIKYYYWFIIHFKGFLIKLAFLMN